MGMSEEMAHWLPALLILVEFFMLAFLGYLLVQILNWESAFNTYKQQSGAQLQDSVRKLRRLRQQLDRIGGDLPQLPVSYSFRRKWRVIRWLAKTLSASQWLRS